MTIRKRLGFAVCALVMGVSVPGLANAASDAHHPIEGFELRPLPYVIDDAPLKFEPLGDATASSGKTARGAGYRIEIPNKWNGGLVVWVQGGGQICNSDTKSGCKLPPGPFPPIRSELIAQGFAWAAPTFRDGRIVPKLRAQDVLDVVDIFRRQHPEHRGRVPVYLLGFSMGGVTVETALELFPDSFDGAVAGCSGDPSTGFTGFFDMSLAAMALVAPSSPDVAAFLRQIKFPVDLPAAGKLRSQIVAGLGPKFPSESNEAGKRFKEIIRRLSGGSRPMFDVGFDKIIGIALPGFMGIQPVIDAGERSFIDNQATQYRFETQPGEHMSADEATLNATIPRFSCDPSVCNRGLIKQDQEHSLGGFLHLSGKIRTKLVAMYTTGEEIAPLSGGQAYANRVDASHASKFLVQRAYREEDHCGFNEQETSEAFESMIHWVKTGERPAGDNIRSAATVAAPDFGCAFTRGAHKDDPDYARACSR
jgi:pimeloyl-ACP methyl ester carboxylesterase